MALRTLELCAGYGGLGLGLRIAREDARAVCYVEREITAAGILAARFEDGTLEPAPIWSDLKTFDGRAWRGNVDCIIAGYPCQPFSVAGKRLGRKDPRHLWPHVARIVRELEPEWCFFENVGGHLKLGFFEVAKSLRRMGYEVAAELATAEEVGAPHRRERLFILARRVADAFDGLVSISRRRSQERTGARSAVAELADAERAVSTARKKLHEVGRPLSPARFEHGGFMADADFVGPSRLGGRGKERTAEPGARIFPPGPEDLDAWREVLARTPQIEPAFCGIADGLTARVDRLRALGNGVVPLVAALAYVRLMAAHGVVIEPASEREMRAAA